MLVFYKLLSRVTDLPEGGWLSTDNVRTFNPWDSSRYIYCFFCSTHDLKAMQNTLFTSWWKNRKKSFLSVYDIPIGEQIIADCYEREKELESRTGAATTRVTDAVVNPNKWSKMNVMNALITFESRTLAEQSSHLYDVLGTPMEERLNADQFKCHFQNSKKQVIGFWSSVGEHLHILMDKTKSPLSPATRSAIATFEWMANVHEIFNNILMNTSIVIDKDNVHCYERQVMKSLDYFESLRARQLERRDNKFEHWRKTFLESGKTWNNLRITCRGFFDYCHAVMKYADFNTGMIPTLHGISVAHSNTSILEAWFSLVRNMRVDSGTTYGTAVGNKVMQSTCLLNTNGMYCRKQAGEIVWDRVVEH